MKKNNDAFSTLKYNLINSNHFKWPSWLEINNHDINKILAEKIENLRNLQGKIDLVAGGPPCQGFSLAGKRDTKDQRNKLVKAYIKFIEIVQPRALIFENVHGFTVKFKGNKGSIKEYSNYVIEKLTELGYRVDSRILDVSKIQCSQGLENRNIDLLKIDKTKKYDLKISTDFVENLKYHQETMFLG